jgi:hypothetical protein
MSGMRAQGLFLVGLVVAACSQSSPVVSPSQADRAGDPHVVTAVLPAWARAGFSEPEPVATHEIGRSGEIAAILFGNPLTVPPPTDHQNKILWVMRHPIAAPSLEISAQRMQGAAAIDDPVTQTVEGGPGPSTVDLPVAGCWRFMLTWGDRTDSLDLAYIAST